MSSTQVRRWLSLAVLVLGSWEGSARAEREVVPRLDHELPDYSIEREFQKHRTRYPDIRPADPTRRGAFVAHENHVYRTVEGQALHLDLYVPGGPTGTWPLVVLIHGGGWRSGDRRHMVPLAKSLAEHGYAAASIAYRTSRQALYPAGLEDCEWAARWLLERAEAFHLDAKRVALAGGSSGAHMATLLGNRLGRDHPQVPVGVVVNFDGIVETTSETVREDEDRPGKLSYLALWLGGRYPEYPDLWREASPMTYAGASSPATLFTNSSHPRFHAGRDQYVALLGRHGIATGVLELPDTPHTFWLFHPWHDQALDAMVTFLDEHMPSRQWVGPQ
jgi:pectinesterase